MHLVTTTKRCNVCRREALGLVSTGESVEMLPAGWWTIESARTKRSLDNPQVCSLECASVFAAEEDMP